MTEIHLSLNNFNDFETVFSLFPASSDFIFTKKKVFKSKKIHICFCGAKMVQNGFDFVRKKEIGTVKVGKQLCKECGNQRHEDKSFFKKILSEWVTKVTKFITILRDNDVSWEGTSNLMDFISPTSKTKLKHLFDKNQDLFEYEQDNFLIVNYDEQHPRRGRSQKFRLTLIDYKSKNVIADELFNDKNEQTIELFLRNNLDVTKKLIVITDCDRRYPEIFKLIWGKNLIHQKCLLHLNKLVSNDFGKNLSLQNMYNKYLLLNIFYNRERELSFLEKLLAISNQPDFEWKSERQKFYNYIRKGETRRRRKGKNLTQRKLWKAKELFELYLGQISLFPRNAQKRLLMIRDNWKHFTAFYSVKDCPATNNCVENFYSTSIKTHRKKQFRTDDGLIRQMKIAAQKRKGFLQKPKETFFEILLKAKLITC